MIFPSCGLVSSCNLFRPCIKSSTNIYLSILAFTDTAFLLLIYVSSKQYHHDVHRQENEVYWRMFGLSQWFYTSFCEFCHHVETEIESVLPHSRFSVHFSLFNFKFDSRPIRCCAPCHQHEMCHRSSQECRFE